MPAPSPSLDDLVFFAEVAERGGFSAAARALGVPKSRLSHRVAALEAVLGVQLLQRSTRRLSLTPAGEAYLRHCLAVREAARAAAESMAQISAEPRGVVRVTCPITLAQSGVGMMMPVFMRRHPGITVDLHVLNRPVDPIEEGVDIALRVRTRIEDSPTLAARRFGVSRALLVASREQLERQGPVREPADLARLDTVSLAAPGGRDRFELVGPGGEAFVLEHEPRYIASDMLVLKLAVTAGIGAGMLPDYLCREEIERGELAVVLPDWGVPPGIVHAMYPPRRALMPAVRALLDFLTEVLDGEWPADLHARCAEAAALHAATEPDPVTP